MRQDNTAGDNTSHQDTSRETVDSHYQKQMGLGGGVSPENEIDDAPKRKTGQ